MRILDRIRGLLACLLLIALIIGVPALLLLTQAHTLLPTSVPSAQEMRTALSSPDDGTVFLGALVVVAWVTWALFTATVLLEIGARARGVRAPRLPGPFHLPQHAARGLVAAAAALFIAAGTAGAATAATATAATPSATSMAAAPAATGAESVRTETSPHATDAPVGDNVLHTPAAGETRTVTVGPGESLWSIADRELGDGARYPEIAALNQDRVQPDGSTLATTPWLQPGWTLVVPGALDVAPAAAGAAPAEVYVVQPGDTLWSIAGEQLGDSERYPEIAAASAETLQPGGAQLRDPDVIDAGWTVTLPATPANDAPAATDLDPVGLATPVASPPVDPDAVTMPSAEVPAPAPVIPDPAQTGGASDGAPTPSALTDAAVPAPPMPSAAATDPAEERDALNITAADTTADTAADDEELDRVEAAVPVRVPLGVGALAAAGVLSLLAIRRRGQQRRRAHGQRFVVPEGEEAVVEAALRGSADPLSVTAIDRALRGVAAHRAATGQPLPEVRAARLSSDTGLDLYLTHADTTPPPGWTHDVDATVWTLPPAELTTGEEPNVDTHGQDTDVAAPYPALVTIGHDIEDGHVLLNLEHLGHLAVTGPPDLTRQILAALTIELAHSRWADDLTVIVAGAWAEVEDILTTGRIRYVPTLDAVLSELTARAETDRHLLSTTTGAGDLAHARAAGLAPDTWTPTIIVTPAPLTQSQRKHLSDLTTAHPRTAIAAITTCDSLGPWALDTNGAPSVVDAAGDDTEPMGVLLPLGLQLRPQRLDDHTLLQLLTVVDLTDRPITPTAVPEPRLVVMDDRHNTRPQGGSTRMIPVDTVAMAGGSGAEVLDSELISDIYAGDDTAVVWIEPSLADIAAITTTAEPAAGPGTQPHSGETASQPDDALPAMTPADTASRRHAIDESSAENTHRADPVISDQNSIVSAAVAAPPTPEARVHPLPITPPQVLLLGTVEIRHANGTVEPEKRHRLTELAAYLALNPGGDFTTLDEAIWPGRRVAVNARNTLVSKLRRWLSTDEHGQPFFPVYSSTGGYRLAPAVTTDWHTWCELLATGVTAATTDNLQAALHLVRGRPFDGARARNYAWAEYPRQHMISAIVDASAELAHRRLMDGRWRGAEEATVIGLTVEPGIERLWRLRILAAHAAGNPSSTREAIARLMAITDELGGDLEPETEQLLADIDGPTTRQQLVHAIR